MGADVGEEGIVERLRTAEDLLRSDCLRLVAHDLNNPLTVIRVLAEMLRDEVTDPEMRQDVIDMLEAADFAGALLEGMSALVRIDIREDDCTWFPIDIVEVLRETIDRPALRRHVRLEAPRELQIGGDRTALIGAFTDVLVNARRLADIRAAVEVKVSDGPLVEIRVRHPGPAIPPALRDLMFDRFGAVEVRQNSIPVSAVGLLYAKRVVRSHGGQIAFEDAPTGDLDLVVRLPR